MTRAQRVGQLFMVGMSPLGLAPSVAAAIRARHFGSVVLAGRTAAGTAGVRAVTSAVQRLASDRVTGRVRFFVSANQEGGSVQPLQGPGFEDMPSALEQGTMSAAALVAAATRWGRDLKAAGVNLDLAPVADVVPESLGSANLPIGAFGRQYGDDAESVGRHAVAFVGGMEAAHVATVAKHFPGIGLVRANTDFTPHVVDRVTTDDHRSLEAFQRIIDAGVPFVMTSLVTYTRIDPDRLAVFSPVIQIELLRDRMGFQGVVVSDTIGGSVAVRHLDPGVAAVRYLTAGGDMITSDAVGPAIAMAKTILARSHDDLALAARVDEAVRRILQAKQAYGLLPCGRGG